MWPCNLPLCYTLNCEFNKLSCHLYFHFFIIHTICRLIMCDNLKFWNFSYHWLLSHFGLLLVPMSNLVHNLTAAGKPCPDNKWYTRLPVSTINNLFSGLVHANVFFLACICMCIYRKKLNYKSCDRRPTEEISFTKTLTFDCFVLSYMVGHDCQIQSRSDKQYQFDTSWHNILASNI